MVAQTAVVRARYARVSQRRRSARLLAGEPRHGAAIRGERNTPTPHPATARVVALLCNDVPCDAIARACGLPRSAVTAIAAAEGLLPGSQLRRHTP